MKVSLRQEACQGHGVCQELCPEVFALDAQGYSVLLSEAVPAGLEDRAAAAAANCPERAIVVETPAGRGA
jgi:ferredoxin